GDDEAIDGAQRTINIAHQTEQNGVAAVAIDDEEIADGSKGEAGAGAAGDAVDRGVRPRAAGNLDLVAQDAGEPVDLEAVVDIVPGDEDGPAEDVLNSGDVPRK